MIAPDYLFNFFRDRIPLLIHSQIACNGLEPGTQSSLPIGGRNLVPWALTFASLGMHWKEVELKIQDLKPGTPI